MGHRWPPFSELVRSRSWPLWTDALELETVRALVVVPEIQAPDVASCARVLGARGVAQVFRARRFTEGKYRNFTPPKALL